MKKLRIFVVDDDRDFAESLAEVLEANGHNVAVAYDGEQAVKRFHGENFDLTFMDVQLPGMNGVESFFAIRELRPSARVVMMTGYSVEHLLQQATDHGAVGVLRKPIDPASLLKFLKEVATDGIVLRADDDPDFVASVEELLTNEGYTILVARNGQEAGDTMLERDDVEVLVLDLRMPLLNGLEVYMELKKHNRTVPTMIVSAYAEEEARSIDQLKALSESGFLAKLFAPGELLDAIQKLNGH